MPSYLENPLAKGISKIVSDKLKETTFENGKLYKLLDMLDDFVVVWCKEDACLYTQILQPTTSKEKGETSDSCQVLVLSRPPIWDVEKIILNKSGTGVLLIGSKGVAAVEIPKRWGSPSLLEGGQATITCHTQFVGEEFFACNLKVDVLSADWHPGSVTRDHVIILASDSYLRTYNLSSANVPEDNIAVAKTSSSCKNESVNYSKVLGETAVDFAVGAPLHPDDITSGDIEKKEIDEVRKRFLELQWPIFILYSNGDIFYVISNLCKSRLHEKKLYGPMTMEPAAYDNYGLDFCSIIALSCSPGVLVIGNSCGTLHHCIVFEQKDKLHLNKSTDETLIEDLMANVGELNLDSPNFELHIYETINLDLSFTCKQKPFSCLLSLVADPHSPARYWIVHEEGLHGVAVPMVERLMQLNTLPDDTDMSKEDLESRVEHFVCTRPVSTLDPLAVVGVAFGLAPPTVYVMLASGVTYNIEIPSIFLPSLPETQYQSAGADKPVQQESFMKYIYHLLKRSSSQPILVSSSNPQIEPAVFYSLLSQATDTLRKNYMQPQIQVREQIERRQKVLIGQKERLAVQMKAIEIEKNSCIDKAHELAEGYEEANERHEMLMSRLEKLMSSIVSDLPSLSTSERTMFNELEAMKERSRDFASEIKQIQAKSQWQKSEIDNLKKQTGKRPYKASTLSENQITSLRTSLRKE